jgi:uncharacterized damage-inducible protein DinB
MSKHIRGLVVLSVLVPALAGAQAAPVATAFKANAARMGKNLIAAAQAMPADKYTFKPTPAQMSFGAIVLHLVAGNDILCGLIGNTKAATRAKLQPTDAKDKLVSQLTESFKFCDAALANVDDSKLSEPLEMFGEKTTRAGAMIETTGDWADHYSQAAIYLRLNGKLPPTAKK